MRTEPSAARPALTRRVALSQHDTSTRPHNHAVSPLSLSTAAANTLSVSPLRSTAILLSCSGTAHSDDSVPHATNPSAACTAYFPALLPICSVPSLPRLSESVMPPIVVSPGSSSGVWQSSYGSKGTAGRLRRHSWNDRTQPNEAVRGGGWNEEKESGESADSTATATSELLRVIQRTERRRPHAAYDRRCEGAESDDHSRGGGSRGSGSTAAARGG